MMLCKEVSELFAERLRCAKVLWLSTANSLLNISFMNILSAVVKQYTSPLPFANAGEPDSTRIVPTCHPDVGSSTVIFQPVAYNIARSLCALSIRYSNN